MAPWSPTWASVLPDSTMRVSPASATALLAMPWTIVVDPGHGGADSGAIGHY
jgi:N-acetylmuramoyl-L-alanine amidase